MRIKVRRTGLLLLCIVFLSFSAAFAAEFSLIVEPEGHQAVMQTQKAEEKGLFRSAARWRRVDLLKQLALIDGIAKGDELVLNLFPDTSYHATVDRVSVNAQGTISIRGRLRNYPLGYVLISTTGDLSLASIHVPELGVEYTIVYDPDSRTHYLLDHDPLKMDKLEDAPAVIPPPPKPEEEQEIKALQERILLNQVVDDSTATVEVMVIYTPAARVWANSNEGSISNVIAQAMEKGQLVADNSGTHFTVHLIHSEEVAYTENGDSGIDLDRLQGSADGYLDAVHAMRNTYAADLVVLVTKADDTGGIGYLLESPSGRSAYAFSISRVQQASWSYTTIHEIGHNMGLHHHKAQNVQPGPGLYSYSAGWRWVSTDGGRYCSVMTYESGSYFSDGMKHTRVPYFSNPSITYIGAATGHATNGDNARTVREIKNVIAAYRQATPSCTYAITPTSSSFSSSGNTGAVTVSTSSGSCSWSATSNVLWITITAGSAGTGNGTVFYSVSANTTGSSRTGTMTIAGQTFTATQNGSTGTPGIQVISPNGGETWTTGSTHAITWTSSNLNPAGRIYLFYWYNNDWQQTAGPLLTSVTSYSWTVPNIPTTSSYIGIGNDVNGAWEFWDRSDQSFVIQAASSCSYTLTPTNSSISASGNTGTVSVTTSSGSCSWTAASNVWWITITAGSAGTGNGTVFYSVSANTTGSARTGTMTIGGQTFTVTQTGATSCTYTIAPTSSLFSASGTTGTVAITTSSGSCSWSATSNAWWITITAGSTGTGNGMVSYSVSANTTGSSRTGTMTIGGRTFTITQNGSTSCTYTLAPTGSSISASGNTGTVSITTSSGNCFWSATSNAWWVTITAGSAGTGNGTVFYSVSANTTGSSRTGTMTIGGQTFTITQNGSTSCTYTLTPTSSLFSALGNTGTVTVTTTPSFCSWNATSNVPWITVTAGSSGTGNGTVGYSISANTTGSTRTGTMTIGGQTFTVTQYGAYIPPGSNANLYFTHVDTTFGWQTEIAIINTSDQTVAGTLTGLGDVGQPVDTMPVTLPARGRRQIIIAEEFTNNANIKHIIFDANSAAIQGYTKFYIPGAYRAAIPAVKGVNTSDIHIPHIDSGAQWWTGVSLVNTTSSTKELTIAFNTGQSRSRTLNPYGHQAFTIAELVSNQPWTDIQSAVITNASGVIGLELFGNNGDGKQLEGILLTDKTASTLYYPHVVGNGWWTGIVAYNPAWYDCYITIKPYDAQGNPLSTTMRPLGGGKKYIGTVTDLGLPAQTAWFKIDSTAPLTGFELLGTADFSQLAAYAGGGGTKAGVFAKIEKNGGWTDLVLVNTEAGTAYVTLTAYKDDGSVVDTRVLPSVGGHAKEFNSAEAFFSKDISSATYIAYTSDKNMVGFQLNGSSDGTMLDGLPGLAGAN